MEKLEDQRGTEQLSEQCEMGRPRTLQLQLIYSDGQINCVGGWNESLGG
jgi:hypothetical protein